MWFGALVFMLTSTAFKFGLRSGYCRKNSVSHSSSIACRYTVGWDTAQHDDGTDIEHFDVVAFRVGFGWLFLPSGIAAAFCHRGQAFWHRDGGAYGVKWFGLGFKSVGLVGHGEATVGSHELEMGTHVVYQAVHGLVGGCFNQFRCGICQKNGGQGGGFSPTAQCAECAPTTHTWLDSAPKAHCCWLPNVVRVGRGHDAVGGVVQDVGLAVGGSPIACQP